MSREKLECLIKFIENSDEITLAIQHEGMDASADLDEDSKDFILHLLKIKLEDFA